MTVDDIESPKLDIELNAMLTARASEQRDMLREKLHMVAGTACAEWQLARLATLFSAAMAQGTGHFRRIWRLRLRLGVLGEQFAAHADE